MKDEETKENRMVAPVRYLVVCVSAAGVFRTLPRTVFWQLLPAPVIEGRVYRTGLRSVQTNGLTRKSSSMERKVIGRDKLF